MIKVQCQRCGVSILVPAAARGRSGVCFGCGAPLQVPQDPLPPETRKISFQAGDGVADRYVIKEWLGQGGMGVVYRALDTLLEEEVALKFMHPRWLRTERARQKFVQEAQVARRLRHENIVAVHDVSWTPDNVLYISMEFLEGQSLRAFLRRRRKKRRLVNVRLAVTVAGQVLKGLEYAHRTVIHRDVKPENVMLISGERVKVLDFGLAKAVQVRQTTPEADQKKTKRVVGTRAYASPEQIKRRPLDLRADLYTVGLVLREMLTLRTPMDEPVELANVRSDVSPSLAAVLAKALQRDRDQRWQSAREFRRALRRAFEESYRPVLAPEIRSADPTEASTENMVFLEGGSFLMGSDDAENEGPESEASIDPFHMDVTPVTVAQYTRYLEATGAAPPKFWDHSVFSGDAQPVVGVTWDEANAYAAWAGKQIPTEAQWEFAARGKENRRYPWGRLEPDTTHRNFRDYLGMPSIVTMHEDGATPEGIKDLAGNVFEWTLDAFVPYLTDETAAANTPMRAVRGGCWRSTLNELRCTFRKGYFPEAQLTTLGFRCVLPARPEWKETVEDAAEFRPGPEPRNPKQPENSGEGNPTCVQPP